MGRFGKLVPAFLALLGRLSTSKPEQAFRSVSADLFGYCITSDKNAGQIQAAIETPARSFLDSTVPVLEGGDSLMVLEIGPDFITGKGFTRLGTWLQYH